METVSVNEKEYKIEKLLGKGKGGYSYLAKRDGIYSFQGFFLWLLFQILKKSFHP